MSSRPQPKRGRYSIYCNDCGKFYIINPNNRRFDNLCPQCHSYLRVRRCNRCGHQWFPRSDTLAKVCPSCKSQYWDRERLLTDSKRRKE